MKNLILIITTLTIFTGCLGGIDKNVENCIRKNTYLDNFEIVEAKVEKLSAVKDKNLVSISYKIKLPNGEITTPRAIHGAELTEGGCIYSPF